MKIVKLSTSIIVLAILVTGCSLFHSDSKCACGDPVEESYGKERN
jgi:hypothetical protein